MKLPTKQREAELIATIGKVKRAIADMEIKLSDMIDPILNFCPEVSSEWGDTIDEQIELYDELYETLNRLLIEKERLKRERLNDI